MKRIYVLYFLSLFCLIFFCNSCNAKKELKNGEFIVKKTGNYNSNNLEEGQWIYRNTINDSIIEQGMFSNGIRIGKWKYYKPVVDSITWKIFQTREQSIKTNIPAFFIIVNNSDSLITFTDNLSFNNLSLVISSRYSSDSFNMDTYRKNVYEDLISFNIHFIDSVYRFITTKTGASYIYNYIVASLPGNKDFFYLFNIAHKTNSGKLIEVTVRSVSKYKDKGRKIFFSVIPSLFIDSAKYISLEDDISNF